MEKGEGNPRARRRPPARSGRCKSGCALHAADVEPCPLFSCVLKQPPCRPSAARRHEAARKAQELGAMQGKLESEARAREQASGPVGLHPRQAAPPRFPLHFVVASSPAGGLQCRHSMKARASPLFSVPALSHASHPHHHHHHPHHTTPHPTRGVCPLCRRPATWKARWSTPAALPPSPSGAGAGWAGRGAVRRATPRRAGGATACACLWLSCGGGGQPCPFQFSPSCMERHAASLLDTSPRGLRARQQRLMLTLRPWPDPPLPACLQH